MPLSENFTIRQAQESDSALILDFIYKIAEYEKLRHEVIATEDLIRENIFGEHSNTECVLAYEGDEPVGFAVYFHNFSTFKGKKGLYLEDLFVLPEKRGKGYGKALLLFLARLAKERDCGRFEWSVLDWNEPAITFYKSLGAKPMDEWTVFRVAEDALDNLANMRD